MPIIHHLELWTHSLAGVSPSFSWLLERIGFIPDHPEDWPRGRIWRHPEGSYLVLEESPDTIGVDHDRHAPGLNHLAFTVATRASLDALREEASAHGWSELFAAKYPHAGGPGHTALYLVNAQGFEIELVAVS